MRWFVVLTLIAFHYCSYAQEICDNGIDDDGDMLIDLNDTTDCMCDGIEELTPANYIPNSSFESYSECPDGPGQFDGYVNNWWNPSENGFSSWWTQPQYYNTCGYFYFNNGGSNQFYYPPTPFPDGNGYIGMWSWNSSFFKRFFATCTNEPFLAGETYTIAVDVGFLDFNGSWGSICDLELYGNSTCDQGETFNNSNYGTDGWSYLGEGTASGQNVWDTLFIEFTPTSDVNAVMFSTANNSGFFYFDNIRVEQVGLPNEITILHENPCDLEDTLKSPALDTATFQWYKDGIALVGETDSFIINVADNYGEGWYQTVVTLPSGTCQRIEPIYFGQNETNAFEFELDTSLCNDDPVSITVTEHYGTTAWSTGESGRSINVGEAGTYTATVTYDGGCTVSKSITIDSVYQFPITISYNIGDKYGDYAEFDGDLLNACPNDTIFMLVDAGGNPYNWGTTLDYTCITCDTTFVFLQNNGKMYLSVLSDDCIYRDSFDLEMYVPPTTFDDTTVCANLPVNFEGEEITIQNDTVLFVVLEAENGCDSTVVMTVTVKDSISAEWEVTIDSCSSECTGIIIQTSTDAESPTDYQWSHGSIAINQFNMCSGDYSVTMTDITGCSSSFDIVVPETNPIEHEYTVSEYNGYNISCFGGNDGTIDLTTTGGYGLMQVTWSDGVAFDNIYNRTNMAAGTYVYNLIDSFNCQRTGTVVLNTPEELALEISDAKNLVCFESEDGSISVASDGGYGSHAYQWTPDITSGTSAEDLDAGDYQIVVTDDNACTDTLNISLTQALQIQLSASATDVGCFGYVDGSLSLDSVINAIGNVSYRINGGPFKPISSYPTLEGYLFPGTYILEVKDSNQCSNNITLEIDSPDSLTLVHSPSEDTIISLGQSLDLTAFSYNNEANIQWSSNIPCSDCINQSITPFENMTISVTVLDTTSGCFKEESFYVEVLKERPVYVPNVFSPNGDGNNDQFTIFARDGAIVNIEEFTIFNRFGSVVYSVKDLAPNDMMAGWNGTFQGETSPAGVYVYYAIVDFIDGKRFIIEGEVSLVR